MIAGYFHAGSGLGDQLFRYITTRTLALDKGYEWGMVYPEGFKGESFMKNLGLKQNYGGFWDFKKWTEKKVVENGIDISSYDPEINFVEDNTIIDGNFEDEKYWGHRLNEIRGWLKVEPLDMPDDLCVISFRGGEYALIPDLFLSKDYWDNAVDQMKIKYPNIRFEVHTDDPALAKQFFPDFPVVDNKTLAHSLNSNMGYNWRALRYAKHLIIANTAFAILPALLNEDVKEVIAPRYWARRNLGVWARPACYYKKFTYI